MFYMHGSMMRDNIDFNFQIHFGGTFFEKQIKGSSDAKSFSCFLCSRNTTTAELKLVINIHFMVRELSYPK